MSNGRSDLDSQGQGRGKKKSEGGQGYLWVYETTNEGKIGTYQKKVINNNRHFYFLVK